MTAAVCRYREAMRGFSGQANLAVWYARADVAELREQFRAQLSAQERKKADQVTAKARTRDSIRELGKLTRLVDGEPRIAADPPLVVPVDDLVPADADRARLQAELTALVARCRRSLRTDRRYLLEQFELADIARKVVGVGSVRTRCWDRPDARPRQQRQAAKSLMNATTADLDAIALRVPSAVAWACLSPA